MSEKLNGTRLFTLSKPSENGRISVIVLGTREAAAKLTYSNQEGWQFSASDYVHIDPNTKEFTVDVEAAEKEANRLYPNGPDLYIDTKTTDSASYLN